MNLNQLFENTQGVAEGNKELPQWKKDWYAKQKPNSWPKHPQPYHDPDWIAKLPPEELKKLTGKKGMSEGDDPWGNQGNFVGDSPQPNIGGASVKQLGIGDTVTYLGQRAKIVGMSRDRTISRITIEKGMGSVTQDVRTSNLKRTGISELSVDEGWSKKYKSSINCSHPNGFSQKAHCAGKKKHNESIEMEMVCEDCGMCETHVDHENLDEACWKGYHKEGMKTMFGKRYPNCVKNKNESLETYIRKGECPGCGGDMVAEGQLNEKQDACYHKVKSRYKVWPSAYASGALVQCRKKGAANWGNSNESITQEEYDQLDENLKKWFSDKWVRFGPDGKIRGDCARGDDSEGKPKCLPQSKAHSLGKKGRASAASRKRRQDPNPERSGPAINVNTKKKSNEEIKPANKVATGTPVGNKRVNAPQILGTKNRAKSAYHPSVKMVKKLDKPLPEKDVTEVIGQSLKSNALSALQQAKQSIEQNRAAEIADWERDFRANTANMAGQKLRSMSTQPAPVAQPAQSHSELRAQLNMLNTVIKKQQQLDALGARAEKMSLLNEPGIQADLDTSMHVRDAVRNKNYDYAPLNKHLDSVIARVSNRITQRQAARKKTQSMTESKLQCPTCHGPAYMSRFIAEEEKACYHNKSNILVECRTKNVK